MVFWGNGVLVVAAATLVSALATLVSAAAASALAAPASAATPTILNAPLEPIIVSRRGEGAIEKSILEPKILLDTNLN